ncbi:MAG: nucleotidyltransferase domain-containing protein, partial [Thermomicrobiales bacterium]
GRKEYLVGQEGAAILRRQLIELMLLENDAPRGGVKRLNPLLTDEQRATLAALPLPAPTRDAVIASQLAHARVFLPRARALLARHALPYPDGFEQATRRHLQAALGVTV